MFVLVRSHYRAALTAPGALVPVLSSALGRLPIAMIGLATLLYVQRATGSFAAGGLVTAGALAGVSLGSVAPGPVDGPGRPDPPAAVVRRPVRGRRDRAGRRRGDGPAGAGADAARAGQRADPAGTGGRLPVAVGGAAAPGPRPGTRPTPTRRSAWRCSSSSARPSRSSWCWRPGRAPGWRWPRWRWCSARWASRSAARSARRRIRPSRTPVGLLGALARPAMRTVALASLGFGVVVGHRGGRGARSDRRRRLTRRSAGC